jgi:hypothetical protein
MPQAAAITGTRRSSPRWTRWSSAARRTRRCWRSLPGLTAKSRCSCSARTHSRPRRPAPRWSECRVIRPRSRRSSTFAASGTPTWTAESPSRGSSVPASSSASSSVAFPCSSGRHPAVRPDRGRHRPGARGDAGLCHRPGPERIRRAIGLAGGGRSPAARPHAETRFPLRSRYPPPSPAGLPAPARNSAFRSGFASASPFPTPSASKSVA